jgi:hypothetical protein
MSERHYTLAPPLVKQAIAVDEMAKTKRCVPVRNFSHQFNVLQMKKSNGERRINATRS